MKVLSLCLASCLLIGTAAADHKDTGKIVWDAGVVSDTQLSDSAIRQIEVSFTPVVRKEDGSLDIRGHSKTKVHQFGFPRGETATFRALDLPEGEYVLSGIAFREDYQSFCVLEKTILVRVESGQTNYLGQFQMNAPSGSPTADAVSYVPIKGMSRSLESAMDSPHWKFGDAALAELTSVSFTRAEDHCSRSAVPVKAW